MKQVVKTQKALVSVFDKSGLETLCAKFKALGTQVYSTGGTAEFIKSQGLEVTKIEEVTEFPEMMHGRVKTLHPSVFGGILARREEESDLEACRKYNMPLFDLVVVNLYPFEKYLNEPVPNQVEYVDIGGPSLLRAASKNFEHVTVISSPEDYSEWVTEVDSHEGGTSRAFRKTMAQRTFSRTSAYDAMIASSWAEPDSQASLPGALLLHPRESLRYGENPHQNAFWLSPKSDKFKQFQGKPLSYNNLLDTEAALKLASEFENPAVVIVKHNNPCGVASGPHRVKELYEKALACDSQSAFGGIVALNRPLDPETAFLMKDMFLEVIIAPEIEAEALKTLETKKNLRVLEWKNPSFSSFELRPAMGGWLLQDADLKQVQPKDWHWETSSQADEKTLEDLDFAWKVCKHVKSNAIVIAKNGVTLGIGAGQMSRVGAVEIAASQAGTEAQGAVLASDAFFPFKDNIERVGPLGIRAIVQPGGSMRDKEVIEACNHFDIAMAFTGVRHFRH